MNLKILFIFLIFFTNFSKSQNITNLSLGAWSGNHSIGGAEYQYFQITNSFTNFLSIKIQILNPQYLKSTISLKTFLLYNSSKNFPSKISYDQSAFHSNQLFNSELVTFYPVYNNVDLNQPVGISVYGYCPGYCKNEIIHFMIIAQESALPISFDFVSLGVLLSFLGIGVAIVGVLLIIVCVNYFITEKKLKEDEKKEKEERQRDIELKEMRREKEIKERERIESEEKDRILREEGEKEQKELEKIEQEQFESVLKENKDAIKRNDEVKLSTAEVKGNRFEENKRKSKMESKKKMNLLEIEIEKKKLEKEKNEKKKDVVVKKEVESPNDKGENENVPKKKIVKEFSGFDKGKPEKIVLREDDFIFKDDVFEYSDITGVEKSRKGGDSQDKDKVLVKFEIDIDEDYCVEIDFDPKTGKEFENLLLKLIN